MAELFIKVLNISISAGWLVLAVILLRLLLRRSPKYVRGILWGLVALRLVCPVSFESALSLIPNAEVVTVEIATSGTPVFQVGADFIGNVINPNDAAGVGDASGTSGVSDAEINGEPAAAGGDTLGDIVVAVSYVWVAGVFAMLIYAAASYIILMRRMRTAVRSDSGVWLSEEAATPFIFGIIKPRIYLPFGLGKGTAEFAAAHERAHLKRGDHLIKPFGFILLAVYWFNPLMWVAYILLCRDIELACDEKVIGREGEDYRKAYSEALLECSTRRRGVAACPLAFGEVGVRQRIKNVLSYKKPAFWIIIAALAVCGVAAVCFLTNPVGEAKEPEETKSNFVPLSAMSIDECVQFALDNGIEIPEGWSREVFGGYVKSLIKMVENDPRGLMEGKYTTETETSEDGMVLYKSYKNAYPEITKELWNAVRVYYNFSELDFSSQSQRITSVNSSAYVFGELKFISAASTYFPSSDDNYSYGLSNGVFTITDLDAEKEILSVTYDKNKWVEFSDEEWNALFLGEQYIPDISRYVNDSGFTTEKVTNGMMKIKYNSRKYVIIDERYRLFNMNSDYWLMSLSPEGRVLYIIKLKNKRTFSGLTLDEVTKLSLNGTVLTLRDFMDFMMSSIVTFGDISYIFPIDSHWEVRINNNGNEMSIDEPIPEDADILLVYNTVPTDDYGMRVTVFSFSSSAQVNNKIETANLRNRKRLQR